MTKNKTNNMINTAISTVLAMGIAGIPHIANAHMDVQVKGMEKCYGIAKAGMNDCGTASHACAGESTIDRDPASWLFVPTGLCNKIAGGSTSEPKQ